MTISRLEDGTLIARVQEGETKREHYEFAAWYTDHQLEAGDYPIETGRASWGNYYICYVPSTIIKEENGSYFGGVRIGDSSTSNIGKESSYKFYWYDSFYLNESLIANGLEKTQR